MYSGVVATEIERSSVVAKLSTILAAFAPDRRALGLNELSRRTGLSKTSVHRLAREMAACGLLARIGTDYVVGPRCFELAQLVPGRRDLREAVLPFLEDVYVGTRETVHLAVLDGREVVYVERLAGHRSGRTPSMVAGRLPLHCTATGKALLAHVGDARLAEVLASGLQRRTPFTIVDASVLRTQLAAVRRTGFAIEREETRVGFASVASPIFGPGGMVVAAMSVTVPIHRLDAERLSSAVSVAARGATRSLLSTADRA
jgi:DNA-binding IclR family transcriptional regulator